MTRHLLSLQGLDDRQILDLLDRAAGFANVRGHGRRLEGRIVCCAFLEPSTRTRLSFEAAAHRLGARVIGFSDARTTSAAKGERLEDTMRVLGGYADLVVLRTPETGGAARGAAVSKVPVVNAGDGSGEHPTQTLVDLHTMRAHFGRIEGLRVAVVGDLTHGRTVHSLVPALRRLGAKPLAVPAAGLGLPDALADGVPVVDLETAASEAHVLYVTRVQEERFPDPAAAQAARGHVRVDRELLERTGSKAVVLHPLPRVDEVAADVDGLAAAKYFEQARNGVAVRMAVLASLLEAGS